MAKAKKLKKSQVNNSVFTGRLLNLIGTWIVMILIIGIMAGAGVALVMTIGKDGGTMQLVAIAVTAVLLMIGLAWADIRFMKWDMKHTVISGNRIKFNGSREARTAKTDYSRCAYRRYKGIKICDLRRRYTFVLSHKSVALYSDR